jgi:PAS domain S-box-containing protein
MSFLIKARSAARRREIRLYNSAAADVPPARSQSEKPDLRVQGVTDYSIYMLGLDGRVASWNAGAQRIKGYRPEEIIGQHFSQFYTEEDRKRRAQRALATALREGRFEKEGARVRKNGERCWANVIIDAIHNDDGETIGFAKIARDVTEQREAREALDRTRETLFQSQKMEDSLPAVSRMISIICLPPLLAVSKLPSVASPIRT